MLFSTYDLKGFSKRLKEIRKSLGYTQENVVLGTGLNSETIRKLENGITIPRYDTIEVLSLFYKVDLQSVLNNYKSSKELLRFYDLVDYHILGFNIDSLSSTIEEFNDFKDNANLKLVSINELEQLDLLFKGLLLSYSDSEDKDVQSKAIELLISALKSTNPSYDFKMWKKQKYSHVEMRILFSIASLYGYLRECSLSNEILFFILDAIDTSSYSKHYDKLLIIKIYGLIAYNYHRDSDDENILKYANLGIDYCNKYGLMAGLPLLLFRKGVAKFHLNHDDNEVFLDYAITLLRIQDLDEAAKNYEIFSKRYRKPTT